MFTVSTKQLVDAIAEAAAFRLPEMSDGTAYLYEKLYVRLSNGEDLRLSEVDWDRFDLDDVDILRDLYSDVLEANMFRAASIAEILRSITPVATGAKFV